jgi:hypothetical protein
MFGLILRQVVGLRITCKEAGPGLIFEMRREPGPVEDKNLYRTLVTLFRCFKDKKKTWKQIPGL